MASEKGKKTRAGSDGLDPLKYLPERSNPTVVIEAMRDLVADDHPYPPKVEGLVLMFAEERRLQDSCWKNLLERERKKKLLDTLNRFDSLYPTLGER